MKKQGSYGRHRLSKKIFSNKNIGAAGANKAKISANRCLFGMSLQHDFAKGSDYAVNLLDRVVVN